mgnify:CR=1 FL=1
MSNPAVENPPSIVVKIANTVFALGIVFSIVAVALSGYRMTSLSDAPESLQFYQLTLLTGVIFAALFGFGLRLADSSKVNLSLLTLSITVPILGFETYLEFSSSSLQQIAIATHQVAALNDTRTKLKVVEDLRSTGIDAYPNVSGSQFISTNGLPNPLSEENIYPLGAISNKTTVYCNESGEWTIFESDEHRFNNPKGLYLKNNIDIMLTGDSFAEGACVNPNESIAAILRESGINVISLGKGGNGSLLEFASFKEYVEPLQPKVVLWVHYANDIGDLKRKGMESSFLMNYITDDNFSQNLMSRQDEIDNVLKDYVDRKYREHKKKIRQNNIVREQETNLGDDEGKESAAVEEVNGGQLSNVSSGSRLIEILKLTNLRVRLGLKGGASSLISPASTSRIETSPATPDVVRPEPSLGDTFRTILMQANRIVSGWDGKLYFVWLHSRERYGDDYEWPGYFREHILSIVTELNIPVIDVHKKVFASHSDPLSLFPGREARHYNAEGYRLIAEAIAKRLRGDGLFQ